MRICLFFDNLFGGWERVNGLDETTAQPQVAPDGTVLPCLPQNDVNLTSPPLPVTCSGTVGSMTINSAFANAPFQQFFGFPQRGFCLFAPGNVIVCFQHIRAISLRVAV